MARKKLSLSKKNKNKLEQYLKTISKNKSNQEKYNRKLLHEINKDYDKITLTDINNFYIKQKERTAEVYKPVNKKFLKYIGKKRIADKIETNPSILREPVYSDEHVLTEQEIEALIDNGKNLYDRALIETFIITNSRGIGIRNLKLGDIDTKTDPNIIHIHFKRIGSGRKEKQRDISILAYDDNPCARYPKHLLHFLDNHPFKNNKSAYLFYSEKNKTYGNQIAPSTPWVKIVKTATLCKNLGLIKKD